MEDKSLEDEQNKTEEGKQLLKAEEQINDELPANSKQRMIVFISLIILFLMSLIGLAFFLFLLQMRI